jgi:hypothetical protein
MNRLLLPLLALGILLGGCSEKSTAPVPPPAAPRGLTSVTGDGRVTLVWLQNTESDLSGYRVYQAPCADGADCPYVRIGAFNASPGEDTVRYVVTGLTNGERRFYAVAAVNRAGSESALSKNDVDDTPRPAGTGLAINNFVVYSNAIGYDFSAFARTNSTGPPADVYYGYYEDTTGFVHQQVFVPDFSTDIQDVGYVATLDQVDFAPDSGWSPSGTVEAIPGHAYVVWTRENTFAKFRVTAAGPAQVTLDWAYQTDPGNGELKAKRATGEGALRLRPLVWLRR